MATLLGDLLRSVFVVLLWLTAAVIAMAVAGVAIGAVVWGIGLIIRALGV